MRRIKITKNRYLGKEDPCLIVAEMSANHLQGLKIAEKIIRKAKENGADAIKLQTYTPDTMTISSNKKYFKIKHAQWRGQTLYELYKKAHTPWEWHRDLKKVAEDEGLIFFSTPFDKKAVDLLEDLDVPLYKIASFELVDLPLIKYVAQTGKPMVMSTGMATLGEIREAVDTARGNGAKDIILLKCVSSYPADPSEMNLKTIPDLAGRFDALAGLSDHTLGIGVSIAAVVLGAKMVEKHFTLSREAKSPDSSFSIEPDEMGSLVDNIRIVEQAVGKISYGLTKSEEESRVFRRSVFAVKDIKRGERFTKDNLRIIRPSGGLMPKYFADILEKIAGREIEAGTPLSWKMIKTRVG